MKKFRVQITYELQGSAFYEVEAENQEAALQMTESYDEEDVAFQAIKDGGGEIEIDYLGITEII